MTSPVKLPKTPTVISRNISVIICFSNGSELVWDVEKTKDDAKRVAKELELELQAVKYVQWHVKNFVQDMKEYLKSLDIDEKLLDSILIDGHAYAREVIDKETAGSILLSAERALRRQVIENLDFDDFIV